MPATVYVNSEKYLHWPVNVVLNILTFTVNVSAYKLMCAIEYLFHLHDSQLEAQT